jgi:hypothetical protein
MSTVIGSGGVRSLMPPEILGLGDRPRVVADLPDAVVPEGEQHQTLGLGRLCEFVADRTVEHFPGLRQVLEQERQADDAELGDDARGGALRVGAEGDGAEPHVGQRLDVVAELRALADGDIDAAVGLLGYELGELVRGLGLRVAGRGVVRELKALAPGRHRDHQRAEAEAAQ